MNKEMQDLFYELKQYLVQHSPKWNTLCDIEQYIIDLENQLEEKDKVIAEANDKMEELLYLASKCSTIYKNNIETVGIYDRLKELSEILERSKNDNN